MKVAYTDRHFGKAESFLIADITPEGYKLLRTRVIEPGCGDCGRHDSSAISAVIDSLEDCAAIIAARIGGHAKRELERRGISAFDIELDADTALSRYAAYAFPGDGKRTKRVPRAPEHPCFTDGRQSSAGRIHLPVCDKCNISCRFCTRARGNDSDDRPGVSRILLEPKDAPELIRQALRLCPQITVAGIAGPGDTLASDRALETLRLVHDAFPELILCVSTNGLALPEKARGLYIAGVRAITVTVNAVDPGILGEIVDCADHGALIANQLSGIREAASLGMRVKVNTVLVPGVNAAHVAAVARAARSAGAERQNILPLIPNGLLSHLPAPTCAEIEKARAEAGRYIEQFRHCAHCRADAVGIPGVSDFASQLYGAALPEETFSHG
ncbi:MAG: radical SAM protein [Oscillospiraceae bacterium]|jgi:nitrogen fixation protein NifB|nr:radical SAM protein [Oscillospiraceae bacterium]